jgi:hypothetical protein
MVCSIKIFQSYSSYLFFTVFAIRGIKIVKYFTSANYNEPKISMRFFRSIACQPIQLDMVHPAALHTTKCD